VTYRPVPALTATAGLSLLWAYNQTARDYLIYAPPQRLQTSLRYALGANANGPYLELNNLLVARQTRAPLTGDYAPPPAGYVLWGAAAGTTLHLGRQPVEVSLSASNLFNAEYRDYLNRFRYYTADLGRNVQLRLRLPFGFK
jgi:iron complex outermembrane receptor protein